MILNLARFLTDILKLEPFYFTGLFLITYLQNIYRLHFICQTRALALPRLPLPRYFLVPQLLLDSKIKAKLSQNLAKS